MRRSSVECAERHLRVNRQSCMHKAARVYIAIAFECYAYAHVFTWLHAVTAQVMGAGKAR